MKSWMLKNKWFFILGLVIVSGIIVVFSIKQSLISKIGLDYFALRIDNYGKDVLNIKFLSPTNGIIDINKLAPDVYGFLLENKKAINEIIIQSDNVNQYTLTYSKDPTLKNWSTFETHQLNYNSGTVKISSKKTSLFSYYHNTLNWKGDYFIIVLALFNTFFIIAIIAVLVLFYKKIWPLLWHLKSTFKRMHSSLWYAIPVLLVGVYLNLQNNSYLILTFRHKDELGIIELLLENLPEFWNGFYGSVYNSLQLLFSLPGLMFDNFKLIAFGQRLISVLFASIFVVATSNYLKILFPKKGIIFYVLLLLSIPAFWINLNVARPDWPMTACIALSFIFLLNDKNELKTNYYLSLGLFCFATAIKVHSLMYIPVFAVYLLLNFKVITWRKISVSLLLFFIGALIFNFEYLSITKLYELYNLWDYQMKGNSNGYGLSTDHITKTQKLSTIKYLYFPKLLTLLILIAHFILFYFCYKNKKNKAILAIAISNLIVIIYHLEFVNKDWQNYYLPFMIIGTFIFVYVVYYVVESKKILTLFFTLLLVYQVFSHYSVYQRIIKDYYIPDKDLFELQMQTSNYISDYLAKIPTKRLKILHSNLTAIDKEKIRLHHEVKFIPIYPKKRDVNLLQKEYYYESVNYVMVAKYDSQSTAAVLFKAVEKMMITKNAILIYENELVKFYEIP
jgi:hypothetical protein